MGYTIPDATVRMVRVIDADLAEFAAPLTLASLYVDPCALPGKRYTLTSQAGITWTAAVWDLCLSLDMPHETILRGPFGSRHDAAYEAHTVLESALARHRAMLAKQAAEAAWNEANP